MIELKGLGSERCIEVRGGTGRRCQNLEVEGMEFCLKHMPPSMLEEAEQVTGVMRCRLGPAGEFSCREYAAEGTRPPACSAHRPSTRKGLSLIQGQAVELAGTIISEHSEDLEHPDPVTDPYGELMQVTGELRVWKDILRRRVTTLEGHLRYQGKTGEQTRAEVVLYTQALRDLSSVLLSVGRLNLDARLVGIRQQTADMLDRALDAALEKAGISLADKSAAREVFRESIRIVA